MDNENSAQPTAASTLMQRILWLNAKILGLSLGLVFGLGLFAATNWLIIKGGDPVGPHLQLLGQYFWGYDVTFRGSLIGSAYGFALGYAIGISIGWIYNKITGLRNRPEED